MNDNEYSLLKGTIFKLLGIDLSSYKTQQMRRRLEGHLASKMLGVEDYCRLVENDNEARNKLKKFLTINVTEFFRDIDQFRILKDAVLPELLKKSPRLNIWSAGCSNGGEPYSVAMLLQELSPGKNHHLLATDLDETILAQAAAGGPYSESDVANIEPRLLLKYFTKTPKGYYVIDKLKQNIEICKHNMLSDPFMQGFDLVICRNVVIYFSDDAKRELFQGFHKSLKENGVLFIGATESLLRSTDVGFERMYNCYYRKTVAVSKTQSGVAAGYMVR